MRQRGRKSSASLTVVPIATEGHRPSPPPELTAPEAKVWKAIVASTPAGWFTPAQEPLLVVYCRHVVTGDQLSAMINKSKPDWTTMEGLRSHSRLLGMRLRETSAMLSLATRMRLTQQARIEPRTAGRAWDANHPGQRLWDRKPWDDE